MTRGVGVGLPGWGHGVRAGGGYHTPNPIPYVFIPLARCMVYRGRGGVKEHNKNKFFFQDGIFVRILVSRKKDHLLPQVVVSLAIRLEFSAWNNYLSFPGRTFKPQAVIEFTDVLQELKSFYLAIIGS